MENYIPYEKLSKKKEREMDLKDRNSWFINPLTRKPDDSKAYNKRKAQKWRLENPNSASFYVCPFDYLPLHNVRPLCPHLPFILVVTPSGAADQSNTILVAQ